MAVAGVSSGQGEAFDDYSLYSSLSDDELLQLAIERSLTDGTGSAGATDTCGSSSVQKSLSLTALNRRQSNPPAQQPRRTAQHSSHNPPPATQNYCSHKPPVEKPPDPKNFDGTVSRFTTGNGKRMLAYRKHDGSIVYVGPEPEDEEEPIFKAIREGDLPKVRMLAHLPETNLMEPKKPGWLALHEAAFFGKERCLRILLTAQPGMINKRTLQEQTALQLAITKGHLNCVAELLERGADTEIMDNRRETPLYKACEKENASIVAMLLNHKAVVNVPCTQGWTPLHEAVCHNNVEICEMLLKAEAKISSTNMYGITPLFTAAQSGTIDTLRLLLKHGADINSQAGDGATPLYEATKNGHIKVVEFLLSQKADANKPGKKGLLPLHVAAEKGLDDIVNILIPVTSRARIRRTGISPLHLAAERNRDNILDVLIEAGFDVNARLSDEHSKMYEDRRTTALYFAVANGNVEATTALLEAGADPNLDTFNPLLVAVRQGSIEIVTALVDHGANINAYVHNHPTSFPATIFLCMKYLSLLKYLLDNGCDARSCFNCCYGNGEHPPVRTFERDELRYSDRVLAERSRMGCVPIQFCETISNPNISRWAGPIIDVLLDYVGHVPLCSRLLEHLDSYADWEVIKQKATPPHPLMQMCRLKIRELVGVKRLKLIHSLPLPGTLINFLVYKENDYDLD